MQSIDREWLQRLGSGNSIESLCREAGWSRAEFDARWKSELARRIPRTANDVVAGVRQNVSIERDRWGIPHIFAANQRDLWFGFGFAIAQDRLFQLDYLRRKGLGRLAEMLGPDGVASDLVARTVGLNRIAAAEMSRLPVETLELLQDFSAGVNAWIEHADRLLPIEFDLLGYRPEPWTPLASVAIETEFRWYLTGRFPVIVMPELAKRTLGDSPLYREMLLGEADDEAILPPESYRDRELEPELAVWSALAKRSREAVGQATGDPDTSGSNNWVLASQHCASGKPMVGSDPHIAFEAVSCWYEVHLQGGEFNVAGMAYVGMPAILCGRNERMAWGITNNICSQRDLYQERTDPEHRGCFLFDGSWEPARELVETIQVRGREQISRTVRFSRNGPVVDEILPPPADKTGPVTLKWLGAYHGGWLTALLQANRSRTATEFREALRPWHVPTFNVVFADIDGNIAVQCTGRIPLRNTPDRGYRAGWDPHEQWLDLLPFEAMPYAINPGRGWLATANNRLAADDYPYPLFGTWPAGLRAARIREMIEAGPRKTNGSGKAGFTADDFRDMQHDTVSMRARSCLPSLVANLSSRFVDACKSEEESANGKDALCQRALQYLTEWNYCVAEDSVAATIFNLYFGFWCKAVVEVFFSGATADLLVKQVDGLASRLLVNDEHGWFPQGQRIATMHHVFEETIASLEQRYGAEMEAWQWGRLHQMPLKHVLSNRGDLNQLLDHGGGPVKGDAYTVCNTGSGPDWQANLGGGYRLIVDLASNCLLAVDGQSQSGHPGSPHYYDQFSEWRNGQYHVIPLDRAEVSKVAVHRMQLCPKKTPATLRGS